MTTHVGGASLISRTIYTFDLDSRTAQIRDYDMYRPSATRSLEGILPYKRIAAAIVGGSWKGEVRLPRAVTEDLDAAHKDANLLSEHLVALDNMAGRVRLRFHRSVVIGPDRPILMSLEYQVPLAGGEERLFYCGSVQPSDLREIRDSFGVNPDGFRKQIRVVLVKSTPFLSWTFDGSSPVHFPAATSSRSEHKHRFLHDINVRLDDWERAWYFGVFASAS